MAQFSMKGDTWLIEREWKPGGIALYVTMAYVIGHILANLSSHFIEHKFCRGLLGTSEELLFRLEKAKDESRTIWEHLFPGFYKPLPPKIRQRVLNAAEPEEIYEPGRALYVHAFAVVKQDKNAMDRLNTFINLYGFCRNIAFALQASALIILVSGVWYLCVYGFQGPDWRKVGIAVLCVVGSVGMLYRYLKFYRLYTNEVFISYPELMKARPKTGVTPDGPSALS